jgi:hypothetical protein
MVIISATTLGVLCGIIGFQAGIIYMLIWKMAIQPNSTSYTEWAEK